MVAQLSSEMAAKISRLKAQNQRELEAIEAKIRKSAGEQPADANTVALNDLATKYEEKWPYIRYVKGGSRARKAVELVLDGRVLALGADEYGHDLWLVNGNRCSKAGKWCECEDRIQPDVLFGKLCQHRLAVALKTNWLGDRHPQFLAWLQPLVADRDEFAILIERAYGWYGNGEGVEVAGYKVPGVYDLVRLLPAERMLVSVAQFQWALGELGWSLTDLPQKLPGYSDYLYHIRAGAGFEVTKEIFYHKGRTWLMEERERARRLMLLDIAAHLPEILAGPLPVVLSEWEARRVMSMRDELQQGDRDARSVWAALPEMLQVEIIERAGVEFVS